MRILMVLIPAREPFEPALRLGCFVGPYYLFRDAGIEVVLASPSGGAPFMRGAHDGTSNPAIERFKADAAAREAANDTLALDEVHPEDFEAAFCIGVPGPDRHAAEDEPAAPMIARFLAGAKPVAAIPGRLDLGADDEAALSAAKALLGALGARSA